MSITVNIITILISAMLSVFVFYLLYIIRTSDLKTAIKRMEEYSQNLFKNKSKKYGRDDNLKIFLEESEVNFFKISIKSLEGLLLLKIGVASLFFITFIITGLIFRKNFLFYSIIGAFIGYLLPVEILKGKINARQKRIFSELPDIIDILSSLIKAGLGMDEAIVYISNNYKGEISKLFKLIKLRILEGYTRKEAYYSAARISFCNDFKTVIKVLVQSDIIGNPIKDVLRDLSKVFRNNQRDMLKMRAERLEGNLIVIIFIFIFIPMLLLFLLPVFPQLKILF